MKFRIYFINFNYYSSEEPETLEEAKQVAKRAGFQSRIEKGEKLVASFCPIGGFTTY